MSYFKSVQAERKIANLALIGFMGVGKSTVGRLVAQRLRFRFLDTDKQIESEAGKSIPEIFARDGEAAFRARERQLVEQLAQVSETVISTGGGLPADEHNLASLKSHCLVVYLWASPEKLCERARHLKGRPLLAVPDPVARIRELLAQRDRFYRQADILINTERRSMVQIAGQILHQFRLARNSRK